MNTSRQAAHKVERKPLEKKGEMEPLEPLSSEELQQGVSQDKGKSAAMQLASGNEADVDAIFDTLDGANENDGTLTEMTSNYLELKDFKEGEKRSYIAVELTTITTDNGELKQAVILMDRERTRHTTAATVVVNTIVKAKRLPLPIVLQVNGMKKGTNGSYYDVRIFTM